MVKKKSKPAKEEVSSEPMRLTDQKDEEEQAKVDAEAKSK